MRRFKVKVNMVQKGEIKQTDIITCDVRGNELDEETLFKRLNNNVKTWQSAWNKGFYGSDRYVFEIVEYVEVK